MNHLQGERRATREGGRAGLGLQIENSGLDAVVWCKIGQFRWFKGVLTGFLADIAMARGWKITYFDKTRIWI